jgi:hypothetical protein
MFGWPLTLAISALVMLMLFRRAKRLFSRQRFSLGRLGFRVTLIGTICLILIVAVTGIRGLAPLIGLLIGVAVGFTGLYFTRFDTDDDELWFTPNPYIGSAVLSLFMGRMIYRFIAIRTLPDSIESGAPPLDSISNSSTSSLILFIVLGFYVTYYLSLMIRGHLLAR